MKKIIRISTTLILILAQMSNTNAQDEERIKRQYQLSRKTSGWFEGYAKNLGGNDFTYESQRDDITASLLTRTNHGEMVIEWLTEAVPSDWEAKIYPDHGWGGKNGEITDAYFREKFEFARSEASKITENALKAISSRIRTDNRKGIPVIVFNSLSWRRSDPVHIRINLEKGWGRRVEVRDRLGRTVKNQLSEVLRYQDGTLKSAILHYVAEDVPSVGYTTYYLSPSPSPQVQEVPSFHSGVDFENDFYKITLTGGAVEQIYDKQIRKNLLDHANLNGFEVFTMRSEGNGAGEFVDIQQPTMEGFDKVTNYNADWEWVEQGCIYSLSKLRQSIRNAVVEQKLILYNDIKRIDVEVSLLDWKGILYREYRMALPLDMEKGNVAYEVPFGVVEVGNDEIEGAAGERYIVPCKDIHPRGIENWIAAYDDDSGVTLSSSVAVADYIDPTSGGIAKPVLQPILLASRKSCHWEGNEYLQTGDHHFSD